MTVPFRQVGSLFSHHYLHCYTQQAFGFGLATFAVVSSVFRAQHYSLSARSHCRLIDERFSLGTITVLLVSRPHQLLGLVVSLGTEFITILG